MAANGVDTDELLANKLNHPLSEQHRMPAHLIMKLIDTSHVFSPGP